jgi:hypothetical protein
MRNLIRIRNGKGDKKCGTLLWNTFHPYLPLVPVYNTLHNSEPDTISFNVFECIYAAEQVENLY